MSIEQNRVQWVDFAKGLSIILVVSTHSMFPNAESVLFSDAILFFNSIVVQVRMPLFFFISGLFIHKAMSRDVRSFFKLKISHLLYLYVLWSVIRYFTSIVPEYFLLGGSKDDLYSILTIFYSPPSTLWFIYAILIFMVVTRFTKSAPVISFCIAILLHLSVSQLGIEGFLKSILTYYPFFFAGFLFSKSTMRTFNNFRFNYLLFPFIYFAVVIVALNYEWTQTRLSLLFLGIGGVIAGCTIASALSRISIFSWLGYVGRNTLPIYLMHFLPIGVLRIVLPSVIPYQPFLAAFIMISSGIVIPLIVTKISKKLGVNWLFEAPPMTFSKNRKEASGHHLV